MQRTLVIIPTYNEKENIESIIEAAFALYPKNLHILVVDDSSPDGTIAIVKSLIQKHESRLFLKVRPEKNGLGAAYLDGFQWALKQDYEYIFEMDADFSHNPEELGKMQQYLEKDSDVIVGSRYVNGINVVDWPLSRILLSYGASLYVRFLLNFHVKDPTAGFVGYKRAVLKTLDLDTIRFKGYAFQIEMKYKAYLNKFRIKEHSIIFVNRSKGVSKMDGKIIWEALYGIWYLILYKWFRRSPRRD